MRSNPKLRLSSTTTHQRKTSSLRFAPTRITNPFGPDRLKSFPALWRENPPHFWRERVLAGRLPCFHTETGSGKSLSFFLAAAMLDGFAIVVSPLVALIDDIFENAPRKIPAAKLHSGMTVTVPTSSINKCSKSSKKKKF
jgi:hypothetical protein